ncbi:MAG: pyridoxamine 5'-phosphate oxidase family protein [Clostridia bacterium]|nr:pyridoxamine 5'-phosphate oxidase family protein [Clostridia bacterium]
MIADNIRKVFQENLWFVATCGSEPNVVPVGFKCVLEDGRLAIGAMLLETTLENIRQNGRVAVAAADPLTAEAYQIKGTAQLATEGPAYEHYARLAEDTYHGGHPLKCAVIITPERLIVASPSERNKEEIALSERSFPMNEKEGTIVSPIRRQVGTR